MALAGGEDAETVLDDLAGVLREAGRRHGETLREAVEMMPVMGSA